MERGLEGGEEFPRGRGLEGSEEFPRGGGLEGGAGLKGGERVRMEGWRELAGFMLPGIHHQQDSKKPHNTPHNNNHNSQTTALYDRYNNHNSQDTESTPHRLQLYIIYYSSIGISS